MAWIGGRKGRMGGNPASVSRMSGDLPATIDSISGRTANRDLTAVLMGRGAKTVGGRAGMPRQQAQQEEELKIPDWIQADAHICYLSRSTGQRIEVVVDFVNEAKHEVEISSVKDGIWKVLPFSIICGAHNPLFPASALPETEVTHDVSAAIAAPIPRPAAGPPPAAAQTVDLEDEAKVVDLEEDRARSRSPRRK